MIEPYYSDDHCTIYHGDCLELADLWTCADVLVTDPPYGIDYETGWDSTVERPRSIANDQDLAHRDAVLASWPQHRPAIVFGSWKMPKPAGTKLTLTWHKGMNAGMGDLTLPWRQNTEEVYVLGSGYSAQGRASAVLDFQAPVTWASRGRVHPNQKPDDLLRHLIGRCPEGVVADPFMGSGTTLRAAKDLGRRAIGIEIEERYCEIAAKRLGQEVLF